MIKTAFSLLLLILSQAGLSQYTVNGNATQDNCHCYTLTTNTFNQSGSVWNNNRINLLQSFTFTFDVFLGCNDGGADGIAFVMQPISTSVGGNGSGMGYGGIVPGVGITLDTYQNSSPDNDPSFDHIAIQVNGDVNHSSANTLTPIIPTSSVSSNIEDCAWHTLKISWDAMAKSLTVYFDGQLRVSATRDLVNTIFAGNSMVFWGFTGATGALTNLQQFCTSLTPGFYLLPEQKKCIGEPVTFYDSTITFGGILKRYWNFGDGSPIDSINANPTHVYTTAGDFSVTLTVIAIDSCVETISQTVKIGSKPIADFNVADTCTNIQLAFQNTSNTSVGTINSWYWDFDNGNTSILENPTNIYTSNGVKNVKLIVKSIEGCVSDTLIKPIWSYAKPVVDFNAADTACLGAQMFFMSNVAIPDGTVSNYNWVFSGASIPVITQNASHTFLNPGIHSVSLTATSSHGCIGNIVKPVFVAGKPQASFSIDGGCQSSLTILTDSSFSNDGLAITSWFWEFGNGQTSSQQNPAVVYTTPGIKIIKLIVSNSRGCTSDTLWRSINIREKPTATFGFNATVCTGIPVQFIDSSFISSGTITTWSWLQNGVPWSNVQNPPRLFVPGAYTITLVVRSAGGCASDTVSRSFVVNPKPVIDIGFSDACKNTPVLFSGIVTVGFLNEWHWSFGDGGLGSTMSPSHSYAASGIYTIAVYATDYFGCNSDTISSPINIYGTNAFAGNDTIGAAGQPVQLNASGGNSYEWVPPSGLSNPSIANPVASVQSTQTYVLKAYTPEGCESFDAITIKIYNGPDIYIPNAFTPNNDGMNDILRGILVGLKEFHFMKIYNRWGQEIFSSTDYQQGWNGNFNGTKQEKGVYVVIVRGRDFNGKEIFKKGTVMLIR